MQIITISGNLGSDAELRTVRDKPVLNFNVGVKNGFGRDATTVWYRCALWGNAATVFADSMTKGTKVFVQGPLIHDEYEGKPQYKIDVRDIDTAPRETRHKPAETSGGYDKQTGEVFGDDDLDSVPF